MEDTYRNKGKLPEDNYEINWERIRELRLKIKKIKIFFESG